jgi:hypothetical protein
VGDEDVRGRHLVSASGPGPVCGGGEREPDAEETAQAKSNHQVEHGACPPDPRIEEVEEVDGLRFHHGQRDTGGFLGRTGRQGYVAGRTRAGARAAEGGEHQCGRLCF